VAVYLALRVAPGGQLTTRPEAVADTGQVEGLAPERGGVVTSRKPGRAGPAGAMA